MYNSSDKIILLYIAIYITIYPMIKGIIDYMNKGDK